MRDVIVVDPMLATGNTAIAAVTRIKQCKPRSIKFMCLLGFLCRLHQSCSHPPATMAGATIRTPVPR